VDGTGSGLCTVVKFGVSGVEPLGSAARKLVRWMGLKVIGCKDGMWMELAQDRVQWRALVLAM
jgi:hypothetical protein